MSLLHEPGDLARAPLAAVLIEALNVRATGVLSVQHGGGTSRLFIQDGKPVGAQVVIGVRPLGHMLLQAGLIDIDALSRSLARMAETGRPQGEILVELGAVTPAQVNRALEEQQAGYFALIAALEEGTFSFDPRSPIPGWASRRLLSPLRTIVEALERPQGGPLVISALQPVAAGRVRLGSGYRPVAAAFGWTDAERALVGRLEVPTTLEAFFAPSDVPPERARAMLAGLLLLGLAASAGESAQPSGDTSAGLELDLDVPVAGATPSPAHAPAGPARRSDPAEARARRQRLLQQAMRNMGIGPFAGPGRPVPPGGTPPRAADPARPPAPRDTPPSGPGPAAPSSPEAALRKALLDAAPRAREKDYFARLGLAPTATREDVKQAFLSLARQLHPDRFGSPALADLADTVREFFTAVNEAYEALSDDRRRAEYAAQRASGARAGGASPAQAEAARIDFQKGEACLRTRDWAKARGFFEAALRAVPSAEHQAAVALALLSDPANRDRERVRALAAEAVKVTACDRAQLVAGLVARDDKDDARAERYFRAALAANPRNADAARELRMIERKRQR